MDQRKPIDRVNVPGSTSDSDWLPYTTCPGGRGCRRAARTPCEANHAAPGGAISPTAVGPMVMR